MPKESDPNDFAAEHGPEELKKAAERLERAEELRQAESIPTLEDLVTQVGIDLNKPVISGLLRRGEVMNIVAPPKAGKSFLAYPLALACMTGTPWMGIEALACAKGRVVLIDNELHAQTIANRVVSIMTHWQMDTRWQRFLRVVSLRGKVTSVFQMKEKLFPSMRLLKPSLIILDSLYKALPPGISENDNAAMTEVYSALEEAVAMTETAGLVVIHHTSKGSQGNKDVTDIGSGAGSQSRAVDTHLVLRELEEEQGKDKFSIEARCRSWPRPEPFVVQWRYPVWEAADGDPMALKGLSRPSWQVSDIVAADLTVGAVATFLTKQWQSRGTVVENVRRSLKISRKLAEDYLDKLIGFYNLMDLDPFDGEVRKGAFAVKKLSGKLWFRLGDPTTPGSVVEVEVSDSPSE